MSRTTKYYFVRHSTANYASVRHSTTKYYSVRRRTTKCYSVLHSTAPYYKVLLCIPHSTAPYCKVLFRTTEYDKALPKRYSVPHSTTKYYSALQSTTPYYTILQSTTPYCTARLSTTKYYSVLKSFSFFVLQSINPFHSPTHETPSSMCEATGVTLELHLIVRLLRKMILMIDLCFTGHVQYTARRLQQYQIAHLPRKVALQQYQITKAGFPAELSLL